MAENSSKWRWLIGPAITILIVGIGFIGQWASTKVALAEAQKDIVSTEQRVTKVEDKVRDVELDAATKNSVLKSVKEDVSEIKNDVKRLLER